MVAGLNHLITRQQQHIDWVDCWVSGRKKDNSLISRMQHTLCFLQYILQCEKQREFSPKLNEGFQSFLKGIVFDDNKQWHYVPCKLIFWLVLSFNTLDVSLIDHRALKSYFSSDSRVWHSDCYGNFQSLEHHQWNLVEFISFSGKYS